MSLAADGVKPAATISDAATDADVLVLMVATAGQAESVLYGDGRGRAVLKLCGVHIAVASEALAYAEALGLDAGATWEVLRHGAAAAFMLEDRAPGWSTTPNNDIKSSIDIFVKDMGLVTEAARHTYPTPLASATEQLYPAGRRASLGRADDSFLIQVLRATPPWMTTSPVRYSQIPAAVTGSRSRMASHGLTGVSGYLRDLCRYTLVGIAPKIRCRTLAIAGGRGRYPGRCRG